SPQEVTTAAIATAAPTALRSFILFIANIFSFVVLHFNRTRRFQQAFYFLMIHIVFCIDGYNEPIVGSTKIHHPWGTPREQVIAEKERCYHPQRTKQNRNLKCNGHKCRQGKRRLTADIHRPIV